MTTKSAWIACFMMCSVKQFDLITSMIFLEEYSQIPETRIEAILQLQAIDFLIHIQQYLILLCWWSVYGEISLNSRNSRRKPLSSHKRSTSWFFCTRTEFFSISWIYKFASWVLIFLPFTVELNSHQSNFPATTKQVYNRST